MEENKDDDLLLLPVLPWTIHHRILKYMWDGSNKTKLSLVCWQYHKYATRESTTFSISSITIHEMYLHFQSPYCIFKKIDRVRLSSNIVSFLQDIDMVPQEWIKETFGEVDDLYIGVNSKSSKNNTPISDYIRILPHFSNLTKFDVYVDEYSSGELALYHAIPTRHFDKLGYFMVHCHIKIITDIIGNPQIESIRGLDIGRFSSSNFDGQKEDFKALLSLFEAKSKTTLKDLTYFKVWVGDSNVEFFESLFRAIKCLKSLEKIMLEGSRFHAHSTFMELLDGIPEKQFRALKLHGYDYDSNNGGLVLNSLSRFSRMKHISIHPYLFKSVSNPVIFTVDLLTFSASFNEPLAKKVISEKSQVRRFQGYDISQVHTLNSLKPLLESKTLIEFGSLITSIELLKLIFEYNSPHQSIRKLMFRTTDFSEVPDVINFISNISNQHQVDILEFHSQTRDSTIDYSTLSSTVIYKEIERYSYYKTFARKY